MTEPTEAEVQEALKWAESTDCKCGCKTLARLVRAQDKVVEVARDALGCMRESWPDRAIVRVLDSALAALDKEEGE